MERRSAWALATQVATHANAANAAGAGVTTQLAVYATPRAGRTEIAGERGGAVWVRLAAPPVDGEANETLLAYLAKRLGLPRAAVWLVAGQSGRQKRVGIAGLDIGVVRERLGLAGGAVGSSQSVLEKGQALRSSRVQGR